MSRIRKLAVVVAAMLAIAAPALADIRSFNAAMQAKDYRKATEAAAGAWATLDKSRADIAAIAREFGFAALMAGDFAAAREYARAAVAAGGAEDQASRVASDVLLHLADLKVTQSDGAREKLFSALQASSALPGIDIVSYLAANALVAHDMERERWKATQASATVAETLTGRGSSYAAESFRFALVKSMAQFMEERDMASYNGMLQLQGRLREAINGAPTDEAAAGLVPLFWETSAWTLTVASALRSDRDFSEAKVDDDALGKIEPGSRVTRLLAPRPPAGACKLQRAPNSPRGRYPGSARFQGLVGTVLMSVDIDAAGKVKDVEVLAAAPDKHFGEAAVKAAKEFIYMATPDSPPGCTLAQDDVRITTMFQIKRL